MKKDRELEAQVKAVTRELEGIHAAARALYQTPWRLVERDPQEAIPPTIPAALRRYHEDPWRLLNAKPEEVRLAVAATGRRYPPRQVEAVLEVLKGLREMFILSASREVFGPERDHLELWNDQKWAAAGEAGERYMAAQQVVSRLVERHLPGAVSETKGLWGVHLHAPGKVEGPNLFADLLRPLRNLGHTLVLGPGVLVFQCVVCGDIGPALRRSKRYCSAVHRSKAAKKRNA
jgi:hypothetical protein